MKLRIGIRESCVIFVFAQKTRFRLMNRQLNVDFILMFIDLMYIQIQRKVKHIFRVDIDTKTC